MQGFVYRLHTVIHIGKQVTVPISKALKDSTILQTDALIKRPHEDKEELRMNDEEWIFSILPWYIRHNRNGNHTCNHTYIRNVRYRRFDARMSCLHYATTRR